jgi:hypothetical protein
MGTVGPDPYDGWNKAPVSLQLSGDHGLLAASLGFALPVFAGAPRQQTVEHCVGQHA